MKIRSGTIVAASAAIVLLLFISTERAEAHRGWVSPSL